MSGGHLVVQEDPQVGLLGVRQVGLQEDLREGPQACRGDLPLHLEDPMMDPVVILESLTKVVEQQWRNHLRKFKILHLLLVKV